jgi:poly-gamma-glutamate system protein
MKTGQHKERFLLVSGLIGIGLMAAVSLLSGTGSRPGSPELLAAAETMDQSIRIIRDYCLEHQINTENPEDPQQSGMIGPEWSEITTTTGDPEAKRTTLNPGFAALIAHLLREAGVKKGDTIAIGSSASFPALLIASLSAARALDVYPLVIISMGSSSFGASNPDFNLWDIYQLLLDRGIFETGPVAASIGGGDDTGTEFGKDISDRLKLSLQESGVPMIYAKDLPQNRAERGKYYFNGNPKRVKAFINSGGGHANIGSSHEVLKLKPGLVTRAVIPETDKQGMIHVMLQNDIPVIHLLFIKGLAQKYNLQWDPAKQQVASAELYDFNGNRHPAAFILSLTGMLWFTLVMMRYRALYGSSR